MLFQQLFKMKRISFLFGLSVLALCANAQQQMTSPENNYNFSVFTNSNGLHPVKRADIGTWTKLAAKFPSWYIETDQWTGGFKDINGKPIALPGTSLENKARYCMTNLLNVVAVNSTEWELAGQATNKKGFTYLYFTQKIAGHTVTFAKMNFRFSSDGKLARVTMQGYGIADSKLTPVITKDEALADAVKDLSGISISSITANDNWVWFPILSETGYTLHPAFNFEVKASAINANSIPLDMTGYVDAITGALLYRNNEAKDAVNLTVKGTVYKNGTTLPASDEPLANLAITINSSSTVYYTDTVGLFTGPTTAILPDTAHIPLKGKWSTVFAVLSSSATPTFSDTINSLGTIYVYPATGASSSRHVNAYYHVNVVHDFMKTKFPTFTSMDTPLPTYVDVTGSCNAFYSGYTINFYTAGGGCNSFAEIGDIIYHEYGHGITDKFYTSHSVPTMQNGALNEGSSDTWAMSITHNPILGQNAYTSGGYIRRYDGAPKVYPVDIVGEVHADGEIIAGAWWDVGVNIGSADTMSDIFSGSYYETPDGPNGTEGSVYHQVLMAALISDDNDADLSNGTPHFSQIVKAFAKHGIYLLSDIDNTHTELAHQPKATAITVNAALVMSNPTFFQSMSLVYKVRGGVWDTVAMVDAGGYNFSASIPTQAEGTIIDYYFSVTDLLNNNGVFFPSAYNPNITARQTSIPYQFAVGVTPKLTIDFESTGSDWSLGKGTSDNATTGIWIKAVPIGSYTSASTGSMIAQTNKDHTTGAGQCLITGNASSTSSSINSACVKNGTTTAWTPLFDVSGYTNPIIEYYRWFSNDRGNYRRKDNWQVQITGIDSLLWRNVDNTYQSDYNWRRRIFAVKELMTAGSSPIQMRFIAKNTITSTTTGNAVIEAGIDDFAIYEGSSGLSVPETTIPMAQIFPNPASDLIQVVLPNNNFKTASISFYDLTGKLVSMIPVNNANSNYYIDTKELISGQYFVILKMDKTIQSHKITIQHQ